MGSPSTKKIKMSPMSGDSIGSSSEEKMKISPISGELALLDSIDNVCGYLKIKDLLNVALVCRSWNQAASREIAKRRPEIVLLPDTYNEIIEKSDFHLYDLLNEQPYVALLFVGPSLREREYRRDLEFSIQSKYRKYFQHYLVTIGVDESIICNPNEELRTICSCPGLLGNPNGILGLFLPHYRDLEFKLTSLSNFRTSSPEGLIHDLLPKNNQTKSTLIIFGSGQNVMEQITKKFTQKMYTLWGGAFDDTLKADHVKRPAEKYEQRTHLFGLNMMGSCMESWSTVVDCTIMKRAFDEKLLLFRDKLRLRRHTIGLACGPRYVEWKYAPAPEELYRNGFEIMSAVKRIFPEIPFASIFNYGYHGHYGVDSTIDDCNQQLSTQMSLSLMIITYK